MYDKNTNTFLVDDKRVTVSELHAMDDIGRSKYGLRLCRHCNSTGTLRTLRFVKYRNTNRCATVEVISDCCYCYGTGIMRIV